MLQYATPMDYQQPIDLFIMLDLNIMKCLKSCQTRAERFLIFHMLSI